MTGLEAMEGNRIETSAICTEILNSDHLICYSICSGLLKRTIEAVYSVSSLHALSMLSNVQCSSSAYPVLIVE
jgi:hypothetical protein